MQGTVQLRSVLRTIKLGNNNRSTGSQSDEESHDQTDNLCGGTTDSGKSFFADKTPDNDRICRVVQLLKKCSQNNGKKEQQKLFPDHALGDLIGCNSFFFHLCKNPPV